ncbi:hypothetical protein [Leptothoe spongobia]|uniref:Uncharacterized protein n=1 Tax=Leptothoe spongobia TAU-MAC 1115 TaxID=1967444 RepID=A0A947DAD4_9CYAN|nr:hypothetical protein [Leptothoe spongobia]MBT9313837.1 hypothetical protein [Leptothoe spongobia TAU-MAC 1115]
MQRLLLVLLITTGAISLSGCGFFSRDDVDDLVDDVTIENPSPEQTGQTAETADGNLPNLPNGEISTTAVEGLKNSPTVIARDLIQSTDPNERAIGVERTRSDPFAGLTIPLVPPQPIEVPGTTNNASGNNASGQASASGQAAATGRVAAQGNSTPTSSEAQTRPSVAEAPEIESNRPEIAALPEIPKPTTAQAVRVSGVIQIGGQPYAIVKAPNEVERYVRPGDRIANDSVLVKRIDTRAIEPRVILVENGIEVERLVRSTEEAPAEEAAPATEAVSTISTLPALPNPGI